MSILFVASPGVLIATNTPSGDSTALIKNWFDERIRLLENKLDQYDKVNDSRNRPNRDDNPLELEL